MKKELVRHNWNFILYDIDNKKVLSVVFYKSFVDYSLEFYLTEEESNLSFDELGILAENIRNNYENYKDRERKQEYNPKVLDEKTFLSFKNQIVRASKELGSNTLTLYKEWRYVLPTQELRIAGTKLHEKYDIPVGLDGYGFFRENS